MTSSHLDPRLAESSHRGGSSGAAPAGEDAQAPRTASDAVAWLLLALAGFAAGQVLAMLLLTVVAFATGHGADYTALATRTTPPAWVVVTELVGLWIGFVGAVVLASRLRGTGRIRHDMRLGLRPWDLVLGPAVGAAGQLLLVPAIYLPFEHLFPGLQHQLSAPARHLTGGFPGDQLIIIGALTTLVVPVVEEMLFRGVVLHALLRLLRGAGRSLGPVLAVVGTGLIFGLAHLELLQLPGLALFGMVLAAMAVRLKRLGPCMLAHATFNLVAVLAIASLHT